MTSHYETLELPLHAPTDAVRAAYRQLARLAHPDVNPAGAERFCALSAAYEVLSDPERRAVYDEALAQWMRSIGAMACPRCGATNRVPPFRADQKPVCRRCSADLGITDAQRRVAQREALLQQAVTVVEDLGGEVLSLAHDALRRRLGRLRNRWGLGK